MAKDLSFSTFLDEVRFKNNGTFNKNTMIIQMITRQYISSISACSPFFIFLKNPASFRAFHAKKPPLVLTGRPFA